MRYSNETFENQRLELHGNRYSDCTFRNCELVYDGDYSPTFHNNEFINSTFVFSGAALRTLYFMSNMYHTGEGGREVIDKTLMEMKQGKIHGHEISTARPHTVDHSLASNVIQ